MKKFFSLFIIVCLLTLPMRASAALSFKGLSGDRVEDVKGTAVTNLGTFTILAWVYATTVTGNTSIWAAPDTASQVSACGMRVNDTSGNIRFSCLQTTTGTSYITNDSPVAANTWTFVAGSYDQSATPRHKTYAGTLNSLATLRTNATASDGSGTKTTEDGTGGPLWGNRNLAGFTSGWAGSIAVAMVYNRVLTQNEIRSLQFFPRCMSGCVTYHWFGFNGTGTQTDYSGKKVSGTVTGALMATSTKSQVPLRSPFGF